MQKVFVMVALEGVSQKISDLIDAGYFAEAKDLDYQIWSFRDKVKSLVAEKDGRYLISTYEKHVLELPPSVAEHFPLILDGYKKVFGDKVSVGIGLSIQEAKKACDKSNYSGEIELFDPKDPFYHSKSSPSLMEESDLFGSYVNPNVYDSTTVKSPDPAAGELEIKAPTPVSAQDQLKIETQTLMALIEQLNAPAAQTQQQMEQQMQQQQVQMEKENPRNLKEALSGKRDKSAPVQEKKKEPSEEEPKDEPIGKDAQAEEEDSDKEKTKIASLLEMLNDKMPKFTELADKNPEAFKKVIALVHKIVDMAKVKKSEIDAEDLSKNFFLRFPVGTVKNGKKKVIVNGKAYWRSVRAGQVKDKTGQSISVRSHNNKADEGTGSEG